jgi:hypothetical protein
MTSSCDCSILPEQGIAWREASETYGIEGTGSPWVHNLVDSAAVVRSCGRIFGSVEDSNRPCGSKHVVGEEDVCHQAAIAASEALRDIYVWLFGPDIRKSSENFRGDPNGRNNSLPRLGLSMTIRCPSSQSMLTEYPPEPASNTVPLPCLSPPTHLFVLAVQGPEASAWQTTASMPR